MQISQIVFLRVDRVIFCYQPAKTLQRGSAPKSCVNAPRGGRFALWTPKMGLRLAALLRILLKPDFEAHFGDLFWDPKLGPKIDQKTQKMSAKNSEKLDQGGSRDSEKVICRSQPRLLGIHCKSTCMLLPPLTDHLQRALAASTGCVYVMRHALPMI